MKFSVCIPNYNYGKFLERTLRSVLQQTYGDFEIVVSDNASTDDSAAVVRSFDDSRIRLTVNRCNVGFAGNLDRAASQATGDVLLLLSSDDVMRPNALQRYAQAFEALGERARTTILSSSCDVIDENDQTVGRIELPGRRMWHSTDLDAELGDRIGVPTYRVEAASLLRRCLLGMQNPFNFCTTAYHRELYEAVEGYGGNRLIGPDKRFHWKLLGAADSTVLLQEPLFGYRVHTQNQLAQQSQSGALKYLIDEYVNAFDTEPALLAKAGVTREDLERAFIEYDIVRHGLAQLSEGKRAWAKRAIAFGRAAYPRHMQRNWRAWAFRLLTALGPIGTYIAFQLRRQFAPSEQNVRPLGSN